MSKLLITSIAIVSLSGAAFAAVASVDTDGDGVASMAELLVVYPALTEENFNEIDLNGNGTVDEAEMTAAIEAGMLVEG